MPRINIPTPVKFQCQNGCSNCCKSGGVVAVSEEEARHVAQYLKLSIAEFLKKFTRSEGKKIYLIEQEIPDCIFLKNEKCTIYEVRPLQCRTFPFWTQNVKSEKRWNIIMEECPGIGEGKEYERSEIEKVFAGKPVNSVK